MALSSLRSCEVVQQLEYLPGYPDWKITLENNLKAHLNDDIRHYAYIVHDMDIDEKAISKARNALNTDAVPVVYKKPHIHLVLELKDGYKASTIAGWFGVETRFVEKIKGRVKRGKRWFYDVPGALEYLTHENAPDKHQYSRSEIIVSEGYDIDERIKSGKIDREKMKSIDTLIARIAAGEVRPYEYSNEIDVDTYIEYKRDIELAFEYYYMKNRPNRNMKTIYITGASGNGKSSLAEEMAKRMNLAFFTSSSGKDIMDGYLQQEVLILDDFRPRTLSVDEFLKMADPNINALIGSRYKNKVLAADYLIITSVLPLKKFYDGMKSKDEPYKQVQRRISIIIEVEEETLKFYRYDDELNDHVFAGEAKNPIPELYPKKTRIEENKKTASKLMGLFEPKIATEQSAQNSSQADIKIKENSYGTTKSTEYALAGTSEDDSDVPF